MSKIVTIPTDGMNPFVVTHNGEKYVFTPGETVEVSDGVALEIEEYKRWREKYYGTIDPPYEGGGDIEELIVTENGTYTPPEGVDGYAPVTVNVVPPASDLDALIDGSLTEITSDAESVKESTFVGCNALTSVNFPSAKSIGSSACARCQSLTSVNFPSAQSIGSSAFTNIPNLTSVNFPSAKSIASNVFNACPNLLSANLPSAESIGSNAFLNCGRLVSVNLSSATTINGNAFQYCYKLSHVDLPCAIQIGANAFASCSDLGSLVLRAATICTLSNSNAINYTKIAKATGYIYVPRALIEDYKAATNWVTFADQFRALEDYTVDGTTTGELDESKVSL